MAVKIRLAKTGRKKVSRYRIVATDSSTKRDGRYLENLGSYNPQMNPKEFSIKADRVAYWIKQGAEPTQTVANLLKQDRFTEKVQGLEKGLPLDSLDVARRADRNRKKARKKS